MAQIYKENDYSDYIKSELKYKGRKPFYFLKDNESNPIYKFMVKYEKDKYMIQLWNKPLPTIEQLKQYLNDSKPKKISEMKPITQKFPYYRPKFRKNNPKQVDIKVINDFSKRVPFNSVKKCLYACFDSKPCRISNLLSEDKEIFRLICNRNKNKSFKDINSKEFDICKEIIFNKIKEKEKEEKEKEKERLSHTTELLCENTVYTYFTTYKKICDEFSEKNTIFEFIYKTYVNKWKNERELIRQKDGNIWHFHHIRPKSLFGCDDENNLVCVTLKEHMMLHALLTIIYPNSKYMKKAFLYMFFGNEQYVINLLYYEEFEKLRLPRYLAFMIVYDAIQKGILETNNRINSILENYLSCQYSNLKCTLNKFKQIMNILDIDSFENIDIKVIENIVKYAKEKLDIHSGIKKYLQN